MTGSVYVVVALFLGVLLYVVLRRRSAQSGTENPTSTVERSPLGTSGTQDAVSTAAPRESAEAFLRPATLSKSDPAITKPHAGSAESGSSHPAYPVAPAKYAEYTPKGTSTQRRETSQSLQTTMKAAVPQMTKKAASETAPSSPPVSSAPWYPEPPADYTDAEASDEKTPGDEETDIPHTPRA